MFIPRLNQNSQPTQATRTTQRISYSKRNTITTTMFTPRSNQHRHSIASTQIYMPVATTAASYSPHPNRNTASTTTVRTTYIPQISSEEIINKIGNQINDDSDDE